MPSGFTRLASILFLIALITSRLTLVLHEFVGHGATAAVLGSSIDDYHLYVFAGGYVHFERAEPYGELENLAIYMGGIALELVLGALALVVARRLRKGGLAHVAAVGYAGINLIHALYYASTGSFHGYGDGWMLYRVLGDSRVYFAVPVGLVAVAVSYLLSRQLAGSTRRWLGDRSRRAQFLVLAGAVGVACAAHAALTFGELRIAPKKAYTRIMTHQNERDVDRDLMRYARRMRAERGAAPTDAQVRTMRKKLRQKHRQFPLQIVLGLAIAIALVIGAARSRAPQPGPAIPAWRSLRGLGAAAVFALALVIALHEPW